MDVRPWLLATAAVLAASNVHVAAPVCLITACLAMTAVARRSGRAGTVLLKSGPGARVEPDGTDASTFAYFAGPDFVGNDGVITEKDDGGFEVRSVPFKLSVPQLPYIGFFDHCKWMITTAKPFEIGPDQKLRVKAKISAEVALPSQLPKSFAGNIKDASDDMRLGNGALVVLDPSTGMIFNFIFTNKGVWPLYERLPFARSATDFYRAFTGTFKAASRASPDQACEVEFTYDRAKGTATWAINGKTVSTASSIGTFPTGKFHPVIDLGGQDPQQPLDVKTLVVGFATFTFLDFADPNDAASDTGLVHLTADPEGGKNYVKPAAFVDGKSADSSRLFGAGATLKVDSYSVELL